MDALKPWRYNTETSMPRCRRMGLRFGVSLTLLLIVVPPAWATIDNFKSYKTAYPGKEPKAYSCKVCHTGTSGL